VAHALEQERERELYDIWKRLYPWMAAGLLELKPFSEFGDAILKPQIQYSNKSFEEVETEMLAVVAAYEGR